jgi:antitoxin ParD1/3/4
VNRKFALTPIAVEDLLSIWDYVATASSQREADRVIARIYDECDKLATMPGMGHYRTDLLNEEYCFWPARSYLIVYRWETKPLEVIAVVHGARDLDVLLRTRR